MRPGRDDRHRGEDPMATVRRMPLSLWLFTAAVTLIVVSLAPPPRLGARVWATPDGGYDLNITKDDTVVRDASLPLTDNAEPTGWQVRVSATSGQNRSGTVHAVCVPTTYSKSN